jgi:endonuclease/exonuclease/phosphatase family metal-dependent hydrolase
MLKVYFTIIFCISFTHAWGQAYTAMTFNIRYDNPSDGADNWVHRKQDMLDFILKLKPSVFGIQEGLAHQVGYLDSGLSGYKYFGVGRDDGKEKGEYCAIFYHVDQHELIKSGTFWLSETPHQISVGWDAAMERICTYGMLEDKSNGQKFWVFNTHFDHRGAIARKHSADLIVKKIREINSELLPVILMGDFNAEPEAPPIKVILDSMEDGKQIAEAAKGSEGTFNGFKGPTESRRIDYIFTSKFAVEEYNHMDARTRKNRNLSDHLPVIIHLNIKL